MALTIGTDTYISVQDADAYVADHYLSTSSQLTQWSALEANDKEVVLRNACSGMNLLNYRGYKLDVDQPLAFPRLNPPSMYSDVPEEVVAAQVEWALTLMDTSNDAEYEQRYSLQRQGVKSYSINSLSETFSGKRASEYIPSQKIAGLLKYWTRGGYRVVS